ncbi:MAG TPA: fibronectin type III domain-containing protein [Micromonosporaceae bacterium]|nr:fibronectin type III domain-containing protein [Micromonosporaceae bacterium]
MGTARVEERRTRDSIVTISTVFGLVAAIALTLFGLGAAENAIANYDASSWLWSSRKGEVARVNGVTGRVDTRYHVPDTTGHQMQVSQTDRYLVLRDQTTGLISAIDLSSLHVSATTPSSAGLGVSVAMHGDTVFVIDAVQGIVRQLDPVSLAAVGEPVRFPPGIVPGTFDGTGLLWIAVPTEGTVVAVRPAPTPRATASTRAGGRAGAELTPREARTLPVAEPNHDLVISALDDGVAVLDTTTDTLTILRGGTVHRVVLTLRTPGKMPARTSGASVPITVTDDPHVYVVTGETVRDFAIPKSGPCTAWAGRIYCPDEATGTVYALGPTGELLATIAVKGADGPIELEVRENRLFINAPNSSTARVVDESHHVRVVDKYANDILGGDPPPPAPPAPPTKPAVTKPGPPRNVTAEAGNTTARVSWGTAAPNGSPITKYVVEANGKSYQVGANQRSLDITGLVNGTTYRFSVYAVNAKGNGPARLSNPVVPTSAVPDPPLSVTAKENPNGTVIVSWPPANGQGHAIVKYAVTAVSAGAGAPVGEATATTLTVAAGALDYGTQYAFTVVTVNDIGAGSRPSPPSNTVVPYTKPGPPVQLSAATVNLRGTIRAVWQPAASNGRPITKYVVSAGGRTQDVTTTTATLNGFPDGTTVTVTVTAVNLAGAGPPATATARTIAAPTLTLTRKSSTYNAISIGLSANDNGSPVACVISVNNSPPVGIGCAGGTVGGLWPGNLYRFTVTATNAAGSAQVADSISTPVLAGAVLCNDQSECGLSSPGGGIWVYTQPTQSPPPGRAVNDTSSPSRYQAQCWASDVDGVYIDARPWGGKRDNRWVRITFQGDNYIPFAWFRLDGGDNLGMLPRC